MSWGRAGFGRPSSFIRLRRDVTFPGMESEIERLDRRSDQALGRSRVNAGGDQSAAKVRGDRLQSPVEWTLRQAKHARDVGDAHPRSEVRADDRPILGRQ